MGRIVRLRCARALPATSRMNEIECGFIGRLPMCILVDGGGGGGGGKRKQAISVNYYNIYLCCVHRNDTEDSHTYTLSFRLRTILQRFYTCLHAHIIDEVRLYPPVRSPVHVVLLFYYYYILNYCCHNYYFPIHCSPPRLYRRK